MLVGIDEPREKTDILASPTSKNPKTGDIPQIYIGSTKEQGLDSCRGCPMLKKSMGGTGEKTYCYHWGGAAQLGHNALIRANRKDPEKRRQNLDWVLKDRKVSRNAKYVRLAVGGDPAALTLKQVTDIIDTVKDNGFVGTLGYTHFWNTRGKHLKGLLMASTENLADADDAVDNGWRTSVMVNYRLSGMNDSRNGRFKELPVYNDEKITTPSGRRVVVCPAQTNKKVKNARGQLVDIDCNSCGMCDAAGNKGGPIIGFLKH